MLVKISKKYSINNKSEFLDCKISKRTIDNSWAFTVVLKDEKFQGVFLKLVNDLAETANKEKNELVAERILINRYSEWQILFEEAQTKILSHNQVIGLMGELFFLKTELISSLGPQNALDSWIGPLGSDKDFHTSNSLYEIKTTSVNSDIIHINNKSQLCFRDGENLFLIVMKYELSSSTSKQSYNLNQLINDIKKSLIDPTLIAGFNMKLAEFDYIESSKYDDFSVIFRRYNKYKIIRDFPHIENENVHNSIRNIKYDLYLPTLSSFLVEEKKYGIL